MNIIIEKSPKSYTLNYDECVIFEKWKLTEWIKKLKAFYYNKKDESYGPFEWEDAISFLKLLDYENKIS